ncbi:reverse transcriptase [Phytophthora megakarya]|uniref:Reverse transcriptase n=1 Tax=Phytophthora megakarya TaxID=4795 RepID=A0A225VJI0_9STRA|nr:reverse transcriptase [Phytophthora megakarya]
MNGVTGEVDGNTSLNNLLLCNTLLELDDMSMTVLGDALKADDLAEVVMIRPEEQLNSSWVVDKAVLEDTTKALSARSRSEIFQDHSDPLHSPLAEFGDVVSKTSPIGLFQKSIDAFFCAKYEAGLVHESKSPQSTLTHSVRKPNGKWRIVHAFNKLNAATIPAQTPITRKDVL